VRILSFCKTKHWVILLTSLLLASLPLAACGENSPSTVDSHGSIAGTVQVTQAAVGTITEFPIPTTDSGPSGITRGPDGNFWFTDYDASKIGRITPKGRITEFPISTVYTDPVSIALGPDGNFWFTETSGTNKIGRITPKGTIKEFTLPFAGGPFGVSQGPDRAMWFAEFQGNKIGRITTQ
jgi:streptogramin lyase